MTLHDRLRATRMPTRSFARTLALAAILLLGACSCGSTRGASRDPTRALRHRLGTNLDFAVDWSTEMPFVDLMRTSRPWISGTMEEFDGGPPIELDARGWPTRIAPGQILRTLLAWDHDTHPAGRYTVLWTGHGDIEIHVGRIGRIDDAGRVVERGEGRLVFAVDPARDGPGIIVNLLRSEPTDPVRDLRVIVPGGSCEDDASSFCDEATPCASGARCVPFVASYRDRPFHPRFLRLMRAYSVIRFMNWADANDTIVQTPEERWEDRVRPEHARWWGRVPLEVMIDLANATGAEPWLTLPYRADESWARAAGALVRERLDPSLRVWVEYSNEVWNSMFPQYAHALERGRSLGLAENEEEAVARYYARRTGELHRAFAEGLGDDPDRPTRMVRVYASQSVSPWRTEQILDFENAYTRADVLAIAPYFGNPIPPSEYERVRAGGLDAFFERASRQDLEPVREAVRTQRRIAHRRGLALVAYEGGQHYLAQGDEAVTDLLGQAARDPRMEVLYRRYLEAFSEEGGALMVHMVDCAAGGIHGHWGALEYLAQPPERAPKMRALLWYAERTRR